AERFARTVRLDWPVIDASAKVIEIKTKLAKEFNELRSGKTLQLAADLNAELFEFSLCFLADSPDFADRQFLHELRHPFRRDLKLAVRLVYFARDFCDQLVWSRFRPLWGGWV